MGPTTQKDLIEVPSLPHQSDEPNMDYLAHVDFVGQVDIPSKGLTGTWQLSWNDDFKEEDCHKSCVVKFQDKDSIFSGNFEGPVAGRERDAIITGRLEGTGQTRVLTFQQREEGYICSYQGTYSGGEITGTWHDTQNRSGRFRMLKYQ